MMKPFESRSVSNGLSRSDGKRPDGLSLIPWQEGKPLCWDVTVICPLANLQSATASAGAVAELAATRKVAKYSILEDQYIFQPIAHPRCLYLDMMLRLSTPLSTLVPVLIQLAAVSTTPVGGSNYHVRA